MTTVELLYEALRTRDARFDGRFFVGVVTTGIYCRPICPARTPRRENVRFFEHAAGAEAAGFRPCRRCRPETAPGTPAWAGTSATVSRALRLIGDGALDRGGVDDLAGRLGVGSRHLRRLFLQHVGATPLAVASTRRLHFARKLLDETTLGMEDVAVAAGFASARRFRTVVRGTFGFAPTELRRRAKRREAPVPEGRLALRLPYRAPYATADVLGYLAARAIPGVEEATRDAYRRTFAFGRDAGVLVVRFDPRANHVVLDVPTAARRHLMEAAERVRRILDLAADPAAVAAHLRKDSRLAPSVRARPGLRVPGAWDPFELAVRAILGQQVSVRAATTLAGRLAARFGTRLAGAATSGPRVLFPDAASLADADVASIGVPRARAGAIPELARRIADRSLVLDGGVKAEETCAALAAIPGVGEWTASYIAMRALGMPDALPEGDLGVRRALANGDARLPTAREVRARAEQWRPWRAYACLHLWTWNPDEPTRPSRRNGKETVR
jgi:AraC family transcriptional regulator of adaptative response / DNA-3-methyladenine glycosylase II